ncbi:3-isopropylmalate dehydratase small subunit [Schaalia cardiffensis F0333]|uniref:3-isopropylmalate dehydratase small subunit n=1 Tax=Schaalia cardiffensis F0333 TaxID=888050 RepID=N6W778_9ACTO|nr:3-isopropylmalate dehydratase small subunit [Schaalia cardiffensis F0333]
MEAVTTSGGVISPPQFVNPSTDEAIPIGVLACVERVGSTVSIEESSLPMSCLRILLFQFRG